jgi:hypothetical protein
MLCVPRLAPENFFWLNLKKVDFVSVSQSRRPSSQCFFLQCRISVGRKTSLLKIEVKNRHENSRSKSESDLLASLLSTINSVNFFRGGSGVIFLAHGRAQASCFRLELFHV